MKENTDCVRLTVLTVALLLMLAAMPSETAFNQEVTRPSAELYQEVLADLQEIALVRKPAVDRQAAAREDEERRRQGLAPRFAIPNAVSISPANDGTWEAIDGETLLWRLRVSSQGARSLNLGFTSFYMPEGARLLIYSADQSQVLRPITFRDNADHGQLWSPVIRADEIVVEVTIPVAVRDLLVLELGSINVGYRGFARNMPVAFKAGTCNIDVICPEGDLWRGEISSVAVISTGGSLFCTGFMVNNTTEDQIPYFMTANHCGIKSNNAASLVAYWNYESPTCGQQGGGSLSEWQSGAYFRSASSASDFTLVELDEAPDSAWNVSFAGWDRSSTDPSSAIAIHHPSCDEKSISFENDATQTTSYLGTSSPGDGTHIQVIDWDLGTTEPGSSGSPLFSPEHRVVGQLHGGYAACGNDDSDWYGRFSISWEGGGSSSSRLKDWLDTGNTGAMTVDTLVPGAGVCGDGTCDSGEDQCNCADDCGTPPTTESSCSDGEDNDCDGATDCDDSDCGGTPACPCDNDGVCEEGEDCINCSNDCISGAGGASCGNGLCEAGDGEDCQSCPSDCNGLTTGKPSGRFCCGATEGCGDSRCTTGGFSCTTTPQGPSYCCGDGTCEGAEDAFNCVPDCAGGKYCGDGTCDAGEDSCNCPQDCSSPPASEVPTVTCQDGLDNDCDLSFDCADNDCDPDPACACGEAGAVCVTNADCCSNRCGPHGTCKK
jgi:hypothetical protein